MPMQRFVPCPLDVPPSIRVPSFDDDIEDNLKGGICFCDGSERFSKRHTWSTPHRLAQNPIRTCCGTAHPARKKYLHRPPRETLSAPAKSQRKPLRLQTSALKKVESRQTTFHPPLRPGRQSSESFSGKLGVLPLFPFTEMP